MKDQAKLSEQQKAVILTMAKCDLNVSRTAREMHYASATIKYHVDCICQKTGLDPRKFFDLEKLLQMIAKETT